MHYKKPIFFFLILILINSIFYFPLPKIEATDYDTFNIDDLDLTNIRPMVVGDNLYIVNSSKIKRYSISTETFINEVSIGGAGATCTGHRLNNEIIYVKVNDGGSISYKVYNTPSLQQLINVDSSLLANLTDFDMTNLCAFYNGVWQLAYTYFSATLDTYYKNAWVHLIKNGDGNTRLMGMVNYGEVGGSMTVYIWNSTALITGEWQSWGGSGGQWYWRWCTFTMSGIAEDTDYVWTGTNYRHGYKGTFWIYHKADGVVSNTVFGGIQQMFHTDIDNEHSWNTPSTSDKDFPMISYHHSSADRIIRFRSDDLDIMYMRTISAYSLGSLITVTLNSDLNWFNQKTNASICLIALDYGSYYQWFLGYVDTGLDIRVERIDGTSTTTTGLISSGTITHAWIYEGSNNIIGIYTLSGDSKLYICKNVIEANYLPTSGQYETLAQLYRCYVGETGSFLQYIRFMINDTQYTRIIGESVYLYIDNVYFSTCTTSNDGIVSLSATETTFPHEYAWYFNASGYMSKWFNLTLWDNDPLKISILEEDKENIDLSVWYSDNRQTENLIVRVYAWRYTGEAWLSYYFNNSRIRIHTYLEEFGTSHYNNQSIALTQVNEDLQNNKAWVSGTLAYSSSFSYILTYMINRSEQNGLIQNITTSNTRISISYNGETGDINIGDYVGIPEIPTTPTWETDVTNPTDIASFITIFSNNSGFIFVIILIGGIVVGLGQLNPKVLGFGIIVLVALMLGFFAYVGLLPLPIFIFVAMCITLLLAFIISKMVSGGGGGE